MTNPFDWLVSSAEFMPHGHCYLWQPLVLWLNVCSDGLIAAAYFAIPFSLYHLVRGRRAQLPYPGIFLMFAAFILLCGTTHVLEIWTVWDPVYRLDGVVKVLTGMVSIATTMALFRIIPEAMLLKSPAQLSREVEAQTAALAEANAQLRREIAARDLAQSQLRDLDRRKDEFLATLAHELRNPLAPIRHAAKLLTSDRIQPNQLEWSGQVIGRQVQRMALLLDDLLDVSRITRGRLELKRKPVELAAVVAAALDTVRPAIEEKGHTLTVTLPPEPMTIEVDPLRLSQAISNLLANATRFTPPGGRVTLAVRRTSEALLISVTDSGAGFDASQRGRLFEMFSQVHAPGGHGDGGLGIGLALVKGLIELHGGSVEAHSDGKDLGAEFVLLLPAAVVLATHAAPGARPAAPPPAAAPGTATILIADDNQDAAQAMAMLFERSGHRTVLAHSGRAALDLATSLQPSVALLDIGMPDMSGYEVARRIRAQSWGSASLLVAITGWGQAGDKEQSRLAGFDRHLTKPVDPDCLEDLVAAFLRGQPGAAAG